MRFGRFRKAERGRGRENFKFCIMLLQNITDSRASVVRAT